jgi:hypothetical protein
MDHPVGFTDGGLSTGWPSVFSDPHWLEADLGSSTAIRLRIPSQRELVVNRRNQRQGA